MRCHWMIETTLLYVDELRVEERGEVLEKIAERRLTVPVARRTIPARSCRRAR
jgi:hypothetical protein